MLKLYTLQDTGALPYRNLAIEATLLETVPEDAIILYLWQNDHTVVIGRHQNSYRECRVDELEADGGHLVRRLSGGGAVYHDLENLNFTFLVHHKHYDTHRQSQVILEAVRTLGLQAELSGRNDITIDGRKFSGNAYFRSGSRCYHHGTLLVNVNTEAMTRFLMPSRAKLQSKGVDSVRSRVVNLRDLVPDLTIEQLSDAMIQAFEKVYGGPSLPLIVQDLPQDRIDAWQAQFTDPSWRLGSKQPYSFEVNDRFEWGSVEVQLDIQEGRMTQVRLYSDAMDIDAIDHAREALQGQPFTPGSLRAIEADLASPLLTDIVQLIRSGM